MPTLLLNSYKQIEQNQKTVKNINLIKEPIIELAKLFGDQRMHVHEENTKQKKENLFPVKGLISLVNLAMLLMVLIMVVSLLFKVSQKGDKPVDPSENIQDSTSIPNEENENLTSQISLYDNGDIPIGQDTNSFSNQASQTSVRIDVENYNESTRKYLKKK